MSDFTLDEETGDLALGAGGTLSLTEDKNAIRQRLVMKLRLVVGEWFLDPTLGTDYFGSIFGKRSFVEIDAELTRAILTVDGVLKLSAPIEYNLIAVTRVLEVSFEVATVEGDLEMTEALTLQ